METKAVGSVVEALKAQPIMLGLIVMNVVIYAAIFWSIQSDREQTAKLLQDMLARCIPITGR